MVLSVPSLIIHSLARRDTLAGHFGLTDSNSPGLKSRGFNGVRAKPGSTLLADYTFVVSRAISVYAVYAKGYENHEISGRVHVLNKQLHE